MLRVETLARRHTGLGMMAESHFLQHLQVMQGDIIMRKRNEAQPREKPQDDGKPKTPEEQFREVMAEFNEKYKSSLYPGGPGWSVNRLEQALRPPNQEPAMHASKSDAS